MDIVLTKLSNDQHSVSIVRADGSTERVQLHTRTFLRHDLAHFAAEIEVPIRRGYWGCVAAGASLTGMGMAGPDARLAETLAGPFQTLMRIDAPADEYAKVLARALPAAAIDELARRIYERIRRLRGHWNATEFGKEMRLVWPE